MRQVHARAEKLRVLGDETVRKGSIMDAILYYQEAVVLYSDLGKRDEVASLKYRIGECLAATRRFGDAISFYRQSLNVMHITGHDSEIGDCYYNLGLCHMHLGRKDAAISHLEAALFYFRRSGEVERSRVAESMMDSLRT